MVVPRSCCPCERNAREGTLRLDQACQIGRRAVLQKLKCECGDFKVDALPNREPNARYGVRLMSECGWDRLAWPRCFGSSAVR